ncbi:MAG: hypothetical protein Q8R72_07510 [Hylemonella sp.]|nr:hypothetical protein [Hylemonella sp.]
MQKLNAHIIAEINDLVAKGAQINQQVSTAERGVDSEFTANVAMWVTRLGQLIRKLYGEKSQHFVAYAEAAKTGNFYNLWKSHHVQFTQMLGVARAIKHEIENDLLVDFKALIQADVFADFLEMGEYLLQEGYKDAAAVIIGTVLEDHLRQLTKSKSLPIVNESGKQLTMDPLNVQLAKAEAYSKLAQKQITTWAHVRNKAAHGEYGEYTAEQVQMMLMFVQGFIAEAAQ